MIILFHLKLDKLCCIGVMNYLEMIFCDLFFRFFIDIKMSYYWYNRQKLLQKAKKKYYDCGGKERAAQCCCKKKDAIK